MATEAQQNGYVECSECGHPLEQHDGNGCTVCGTCPTRWTKAEVEAVRRREGLPGRWNRSRVFG